MLNKHMAQVLRPVHNIAMYSVITVDGREWSFYCIHRAAAFANKNPNSIRSWS